MRTVKMSLITRTSDGNFIANGREIKAVQDDREFRISDVEIITEGVVEFSLTSEEPYERWFGMEVLRHTTESVELARVENGSAPLLENHDPDKFIGNIQKAIVDPVTKKLRVTAKFELDNPYDTRGNKIYHRVKNGTLKTVSGGYRYVELEREERSDGDYYVATKWELIEGSFTPTPADFTVGVGRSMKNQGDEEQENTSRWENLNQKVESVLDMVNGFSSGDKNMQDNNNTSIEIAEADRNEILREERQRAAAITVLGAKYGCAELAQKCITDGLNLRDARLEILEKTHSSTQQPVARTTDGIGLNQDEQQRYSFIKAINASLNGGFRGNSFEKEVHDELVKKAQQTRNYKENGNILIPLNDLAVNKKDALEGFEGLSRSAAMRNYLSGLMKRDQTVGDPLFGGNLVETELLSERFIDIFRNRSIMRQMGMQSLTGLVGNVDIPKQTAGAIDGNSVYWVPEDADVGQIDAQFGLVKFRPKNVGSYMYVTRSMLLHSSIGMDNFIRRELAIALALGIDKAAIDGTGTNDEPLGILNTGGVNPIIFGANGDFPSWEKLVQFETKIATANADERTMGWVMNARMRGELKSRQKFPGSNGETLWQSAMTGSNQGYVNGYRTGVSNQVPGNLVKGTGTDLNAMIFGDFSRLICAEWGTYELAADPYFKFLAGGVRVRIIHTCDVQVTQEKAFSVATDVSTPFSDAA